MAAILTICGVSAARPCQPLGSDIRAAVAELVDAQASGACVRKDVEVRLLSAALKTGPMAGLYFSGPDPPDQSESLLKVIAAFTFVSVPPASVWSVIADDVDGFRSATTSPTESDTIVVPSFCCVPAPDP